MLVDIVPPTVNEITAARAAAANSVNRMMTQTYYCQIEERYHPCSEQVRLSLTASALGVVEQLARLNQAARRNLMASLDSILDHLRGWHQANECAEKVVRGEPEIPEILYKYIPKHRIGSGAPNSLRATQLRALNDVMECSVATMNTDDEMDILQFMALVQSRLGEHLGITPEWEDLLTRASRYGDLRLSTFIQDYLTPHVGVVSLSTDPLVPTMWAHYSQNTGIVVGYDTETLRNLGFALRPMLYSEMAPTYRPAGDDTIQLSFFDRERLQEQIRQGETPNSFSVIATANLAEMGAGWRSLSPLLFVKGTAWTYEKEVRLLVDLDNTRDTGEKDENCWPVKVLDVPPEAIREIHHGENTRGRRRLTSCRGGPRGQKGEPLGPTSIGPRVQDSAYHRVEVLTSNGSSLQIGPGLATILTDLFIAGHRWPDGKPKCPTCRSNKTFGFLFGTHHEDKDLEVPPKYQKLPAIGWQ